MRPVYAATRGSPCCQARLRPIYWLEMLTRRNILLLAALLLFLSNGRASWALSGPEALAVAESGTAEQMQEVLRTHSVDDLFRVRRGGRGLLHLCLSRGEAYWGPLLAAGWPIAQEKGWTPQHEAALVGLEPAMRALLKAGAAPNAKESVNGGTPLHVAAFNGHLPVVKLLVSAGANVNSRDYEGWTPLSQARDQGFPNVVEWLKAHGATR